MASTIRARIELDGAAEVKAQLAQLKALFTDTGAAIEGIGNSFSNLAGQAAMFTAKIAAVQAAVLAAGAAFVKLGEESKDSIDAIGDAAEAVGLTVEEFQKMSGAAEAAGMAGNSINKVFRKISVDMEEAANKTGKFAEIIKTAKDGTETKTNKDPYKKWGISLTGMLGQAKSFEQVVKDIADAYSKLDASARPGMLKDLGFKPKDAAEFAQLIQLGAKGVDQLAKSAEKFKYVPTDKDNEIVNRSIAAASLLKDAWEKFKIETGKAFIPFSTEFDKRITQIISTATGPLSAFTEYVASKAKPVMEDFITLLTGGRRFNDIQFAVWQGQFEMGLAKFQTYYATYVKPFMDGFVTGVQNGLKFVVTAFTTALDAIGAVLAPIGSFLAPIKDALSQFITPENVGVVTGFGVVLYTVLLPALKALMPIVSLVVSSFGLLTAALSPTGLLFLAVAGIAFAVVMNWDKIKAKTEEIWNNLPTLMGNALTAAGNAVSAGLTAVANFFSSKFDSIKTYLLGWFDWFSNAISGAMDTISKMGSSAASALGFGGGGGGKSGYASGGLVRGAGTGTSDSIPAWLSNGEFVIRAAAVRKLGLGLLTRLNNGLSPPNLSRGRLGFSSGGLVGSVAGGGGGAVFNINLNGKTFGPFSGDSGLADQLAREATATRISSTTQRRPSRIS